MGAINLEKMTYERQEDPTSNRMCGAAALSMVLRSFEIVSTQEDLWPKISTPGATGATLGRTYLLAAEAIRQGLSALVVQARNPLHMLKRCQEKSIPAVINHRANLDSPAGHYSVLLGVKDGYALVHDPLLGPSRRMLILDLLKLWQPRGTASEITGNVLVAFAQSPSSCPPCAQCGTVIPDAFPCPGCQKTIPLQPARILGCVKDGCAERNWETIFCPFCDARLSSLRGQTPVSAAEGKAADSKAPEAFPDLNVAGQLTRAFEMIEALCAAVLAAPQAAANPLFKQLVDQIQAKKADLLTLELPKPPSASDVQALREFQFPPIQVSASDSAKPKELKPIDADTVARQLLVELGLDKEASTKGPPKISNADEPQLTPNTREIQRILKKKGLWK